MNKPTSRRIRIPSLGFRFTEAEDKAIDRAKIKAAHYMVTYGKGRTPFMIDKTKYSCLNEPTTDHAPAQDITPEKSPQQIKKT